VDGFIDALRRSLFPVQVLLVDDDAEARDAVRRVLEHHGYTVVEAADGAAALGILERSHVPVDLLLTDVQMPGVPGDELGRRVREGCPDLPILYVSGDARFASLPASTPGPCRFLAKPFVVPELLDTLRELLGTADPAPDDLLRPALEL
jgi:CheY-like chemotaxis protein